MTNEVQDIINKGVLSVKVVDNKPGAIAGVLLTPVYASEMADQETKQLPWVEWFDSDIDFAANALSRTRLSTTHGRILADKKVFTTGTGLTVTGTDQEINDFNEYAENVNAEAEHLSDIWSRVVTDKTKIGNGFIEVVKMPIKGTEGKTRVNMYHKDASCCKIARDKKGVYFTRDWTKARVDRKAPLIPMFPNFGKVEGMEGQRSIIHIFDYEPGFYYYGLPDYISAYYSGWIDIDYQIPAYNLTRFKNQFRGSGMLVLVGRNLTPAQAATIEQEIQDNYTGEGNNSKLIVVTVNDESVAPKFVPFDDAPDGAFESLQKLANENIVIAHRWRQEVVTQQPGGLSAPDTRAAFEYVYNTVIEPEQISLARAFQRILKNVVGLKFEALHVLSISPLSLSDRVNPEKVLTIDEQREELGRAAATPEQHTELQKAAADVKQTIKVKEEE